MKASKPWNWLQKLRERWQGLDQRSIETALLRAEAETRAQARLMRDELGHRLMLGFEDFSDATQEFNEWLIIDLVAAEQRFLEKCLEVADPTQIDLLEFLWRQQRGPLYHTGQASSSRNLQCEYCGKVLHFTHPSHLPPCPVCHSTEFSRV